MTEEAAVQPTPKRRGRPPKSANVVREAPREAKHDRWAKSNWEQFTPSDDDTPDRLRIPKENWPEGFALLWGLDSTYGKPETQFRMRREREGGWQAVHQEDFDYRYDGMFMKKGVYGQEITMDGLVLMARPMELQIAAQKRDNRLAREQVAIKEQALRGGDLQTSLDSRHPSAVNSNRITKTYERIEIPKD